MKADATPSRRRIGTHIDALRRDERPVNSWGARGVGRFRELPECSDRVNSFEAALENVSPTIMDAKGTSVSVFAPHSTCGASAAHGV